MTPQPSPQPQSGQPGQTGQTVADLGKLVKSKYPGQYDDLIDAEVGSRVKARYPGAYDDFADIPDANAQPQPQPSSPDTVHSRSFITGKPLDVDMSRINPRMDADRAAGQQVVQGTKGVFAKGATGDQRAESAHQAIEGGMHFAGAALPALAPMSPVATAVGLGAGMGGQFAGKTAAQAAGAGPGTANLIGDVTGAAAGLGAGKLAGGLHGPITEDAGMVDPHVASIRAWGFGKDPKILDDISNGDVKLTSGLSDLKPHFQSVHTNAEPKGYANESVLKALPNAKAANRQVWDQWMTRAQGQTTSGRGIVQATADALKQTVGDERAAAILDEAVRNYGRNLTAPELESLLEQKNGELAGFYSRDAAAQEAARQAGADTLKTQALLEAQARAIRESLYNLLDPEGTGAGPREVQSRYGALKSIERGAQDERARIIGEHPVNIYERGANLKLDPRAALKQKLGSTEWLIENALNSVPDAGPLPTPNGPYPYNPRQIGQGSIRVGPITPDASSVRSVPAQPPYFGENRQLPPVPPGQPPLNVQPRRSGGPIRMTPSGWPDVNPPLPRALPAPPQSEGFQVVRHAPAPGQPMPAQSTSTESIATRMGKQIWSALGGPKIE